jgi:hypothetical protein
VGTVATVTVVRVASLHVYPVKSTRGVDLTSAVVEPWGLAGDRRWMVVDGDGRLVTAREEPRLLSVAAQVLGEGELTVTGPHAAALSVTDASGQLVPVQVWNDVVLARHPSDDADTWFGKLLEREVRLVWLDDPMRRNVDPRYGRPGDQVSFADAVPLHLTATASLRLLNDWIADETELRDEPPPVSPLPMRRFRPSVVVDTEVPFDEDRWTRLRIGTVAFRAVKRCARCVLTTIDPETLESGKEPIRTLARHRRCDGKVWFGVNLVPDGIGRISVGDDLTVLA